MFRFSLVALLPGKDFRRGGSFGGGGGVLCVGGVCIFGCGWWLGLVFFEARWAFLGESKWGETYAVFGTYKKRDVYVA